MKLTCLVVFLLFVAASLTAATPNVVPLAGGSQVSLSGSNLGNGNDIDEVRVGNTVATIVSQTASGVVIVAPAATAEGAVAVTVRSVSHGTTTLQNALTYRTFFHCSRTQTLILTCARCRCKRHRLCHAHICTSRGQHCYHHSRHGAGLR